MDRSEKSVLVVTLTLIAVGACLILGCLSVLLFISNNGELLKPLPTQEVFTPSPMTEPTLVSQVPTPTAVPAETLTEAQLTLLTLQQAEIPVADLRLLAAKFEGKTDIPLQLTSKPTPYEVGDRLDFIKLNVDTNVTTKVTATLKYASESLYFWVEDGVTANPVELKEVVKTFEDQIYPTDQEFFGKEWIPGVDNDPHLYILYASDMGTHLAGYNSSADEVLPAAHEKSNAHEMFYINSDVQTLSDPYTLSVMAHELQHLIHGYHDLNEELWLNEGFSELATLLSGYSAGGFDGVYAYNTDIQLNDWSTDDNINDAHYGASFLFTTYLLDRFGEGITKDVVADPLNGFASIDHVLAKNRIEDPITGNLTTANDLFADWAITNYVDDPGFGDGRYSYKIYPAVPEATSSDTIYDCANADLAGSVSQYGVDYIELDCAGAPIDLEFTGSPVARVIPVTGEDGSFMWSNRADASLMSLSATFDFSKVGGPITLSYDTWYELETDYDYVYLTAAELGQKSEIIHTPSCTTLDTVGNSYGCGYNGSSDGWITENVDLSKYAGKIVEISFEYVTDEAVSGEGFLLDNIRIPEIGYATDFETDNGRWEGEGFVRIENYVPQSFLISILNLSNNTVQKFAVEDGKPLKVHLDALPDGERYVLVISGSNRFTRQKAEYIVNLNQK